MKKNTQLLTFIFSLLCFISLDLKASQADLRDNDEADQQSAGVVSRP